MGLGIEKWNMPKTLRLLYSLFSYLALYKIYTYFFLRLALAAPLNLIGFWSMRQKYRGRLVFCILRTHTTHSNIRCVRAVHTSPPRYLCEYYECSPLHAILYTDDEYTNAAHRNRPQRLGGVLFVRICRMIRGQPI